MMVDLGNATASVAITISVIDNYIRELYRIERIPHSITLHRTINGSMVDLSIIFDPPRFEMVKPLDASPYTRLLLLGIIEMRPAGQPNDPPQIFALDAKPLLSLVKRPQAQVGLQYDGVDGLPSKPLTALDIDEFFLNPQISILLDTIRFSGAAQLIEGLSASIPGSSDDVDSWSFELTLMPAADESVDSFAATVAPLDSAVLGLRESFVPSNQELAVAYNRSFLDLMLSLGAQEKVGQIIDKAKILDLFLEMGDEAVLVDGHAEREVTIFPNVNISFQGPMHPLLVRGTTVMSFDMNDVNVEIDASDEIFYTVFKWFVTILAGALLLTGFGSLMIASIVLWATVVQAAWNADVQIGNAPNFLRHSLAAALGAQLSLLAATLDDDTQVGQLRIDSTPDSVKIIQGNMVFFAQIFVVPMALRLNSAEYSKKLRRFVVFELEDGRRFRAQELARLMAAGKITIPGFHQVNSNYVRANPDDLEANNLLRTFKSHGTTEAVLPNV